MCTAVACRVRLVMAQSMSSVAAPFRTCPCGSQARAARCATMSISPTLPPQSRGLHLRGDWSYQHRHRTLRQRLHLEGDPGEVSPPCVLSIVLMPSGCRPGYALAIVKALAELDRAPTVRLEDGIGMTLQWYRRADTPSSLSDLANLQSLRQSWVVLSMKAGPKTRWKTINLPKFFLCAIPV